MFLHGSMKCLNIFHYLLGLKKQICKLKLIFVIHTFLSLSESGHLIYVDVKARLCSTQMTDTQTDREICPSPALVMHVIWSVFTQLSHPSLDRKKGAIPLEILGAVLSRRDQQEKQTREEGQKKNEREDNKCRNRVSFWRKVIRLFGLCWAVVNIL